MNRDFYNRPFRMVFRFGEAQQGESFDMPRPKRPDQLSSRAVTSHTDGPSYAPTPTSPIEKVRGGAASFVPRSRESDMFGNCAVVAPVNRRK